MFAQPTGQTCTVANGSGTIGGADVTNVAVTCVTNTIPRYTIGGTVSGLSGSGLVLRNNGTDNRTVTANGSFTFATPLTQWRHLLGGGGHPAQQPGPDLHRDQRQRHGGDGTGDERRGELRHQPASPSAGR